MESAWNYDFLTHFHTVPGVVKYNITEKISFILFHQILFGCVGAGKSFLAVLAPRLFRRATEPSLIVLRPYNLRPYNMSWNYESDFPPCSIITGVPGTGGIKGQYFGAGNIDIETETAWDRDHSSPLLRPQLLTDCLVLNQPLLFEEIVLVAFNTQKRHTNNL